MSYQKIFVAAFCATLAMTGFMLIAPVVGLPRMDMGSILGEMFNGNKLVGWILHFVLGIIFAIPYVLMFNHWIPVEHKIARGAIYGILVFVLSEIIITAVNISGHLKWDEKESIALMVFGNSIACMIYGAVLGAFFERKGYDVMEEAKRA